MGNKPARSGLDAFWSWRFVLGAGLGAVAVYAANQLSADYRAGEGVFLLVAAAALGGSMAWGLRGNGQAFGLGVLAVGGVALAYLAVVLVIVVFISATGGSIS